MNEGPTHARIAANLPRKKPDETSRESDDEDDDESGDADDDDDELASDDSAPDSEEDDEETEDDEESESDPPTEPSRRSRPRRRPRGPGGMGRPSTGPRVRHSAAGQVGLGMEPQIVQVVDEDGRAVEADISSWPGTAEAAKMVGRHTSTIKIWRSQKRIRAVQDSSGCWRHNPDDLAEAIDTPDGTDPGTVLAQGMTAIVTQGASAYERVLEMTELATDGLRTATDVLKEELKRAYSKIADLEDRLDKMRERLSSDRGMELQHERRMKQLDIKHEVELAGAKETSERIAGLLSIVGPIAASIGQRLLGNVLGEGLGEGFGLQASGLSGAPAPNSLESSSGSKTQDPKPKTGDEGAPLETRIMTAMARLCELVRKLDATSFADFRSMVPKNVAEALDAIKKAENDNTVGKALAVLVRAAQGLSDLQFKTLQPIAPADIAVVLAELRALLRSEESPS